VSPKGAATHLLIVDDHPVILQILRTVFEDEPLRLTAVGCGRDAMAVIEEQGCDLLITDKNLPDIGGIELLKAAKARNPLAEVIIITGYASIRSAISAIEHDAFDYVVKPLDNVFDIRKKVQRALEKQSMARENQRLLAELRANNAELQEALADARRLRDELIQSEKLAGLGTLAAGVAHEISSPLFGVMGLAEAITIEDDLEIAREHAREVVEYCQSIRDIVVDLSGYSRAAATEFPTSVGLAVLVDDARRLVERAGVSARFELDIPEDLEITMRAGEGRQVFVNLLKNAAEAGGERHGPAGGTVEVAASLADSRVLVTVTDDGCGISEDDVGRVFDPFFTTKPPGSGTGLGLNVVYRILTKYRARIQVESAPDRGTRFTLSFPAPT